MSEESGINFKPQSAAPTISTVFKSEAAIKSEEASEASIVQQNASVFDAQKAPRFVFSFGSGSRKPQRIFGCKFLFVSTSIEIHNSSFLKKSKAKVLGRRQYLALQSHPVLELGKFRSHYFQRTLLNLLCLGKSKQKVKFLVNHLEVLAHPQLDFFDRQRIRSLERTKLNLGHLKILNCRK